MRGGNDKDREMHKLGCVTLLLTLWAAAPAQAAEENEGRLIAILRSDAPRAEKAITCKRLVLYGTKEAVPALAALLPDAELTSWARIALEAIPGPEADAALREAAGKVAGLPLVGIVNSIGVRRDAAAVDTLAGLLANDDVEVASAAAAALGAIGGAPAAAVLTRALVGAPAAVRPAVGEGCVLCAERLLAAGMRDAAVKLYDAVRNSADMPKQRLVDATRGAILARQAAGVPLLAAQLAAADKALFALGLTVAREMPGADVTKALAAALERATPERQALLLMALADRDDPSTLPAILQAAASGSKPVKLAAMGVLGRVGSAACLPLLLDAAAQADADVAQAAKAALEDLSGKDVDAELAARLDAAGGPMRAVLIELAGKRRIAAAVPALIKAADDAEAGVRAAALTALGAAIGPADLAFLIGRATAPRHAEDGEPAERALLAACIRMPDGEACAAQLADALWDLPVSTKSTVLKRRRESAGNWVWVPVSPRSTLLEVLGAMGGAKALATMVEAAKDDDAELQDTAIRMLGQWLTTDAAPALLDLTRTASSPQNQARALQGYLRLARDFPQPEPQRAEMCAAALRAAKRPEERKLALDAMAKHPSIAMLRALVEAAKTPELKDEAGAAALAMAQKIGGDSADVPALLAQLGRAPMKIEILKAEYGAGATVKDVTATLARYAGGFPLILLPSPNYNTSFGGDPVPGVVKQLKIAYRIDGKQGEVTLRENAPVLLPVPE